MYSRTTPIAGQLAGEDMVILDIPYIHLNKVTFTSYDKGVSGVASSWTLPLTRMCNLPAP